MKRKGNIYAEIYDIQNLRLAAKIAAKGKSKQKSVIAFNKNPEANLLELQQQLITRSYKTSKYIVFPIYKPKERMISRLPFIDRVAQHAIMLVLEPVLVSTFTADTYSCIRGKGIHAASNALGKAMKDVAGTKYCLKLDIRKFYPSIDHDVLKQLLRRKIKDNDVLQLLDEIIDSADGVPIGNLLSQYFANFYLTPFDHWIKEKMGVKYYFRYSDDMIILSGSKDYLHKLRVAIEDYLRQNLKLEVKSTYQVFPIHPTNGRAVDFVGYPRYHTHVLIRKPNKKTFARAVKNKKSRPSIQAHRGWAGHANTKNLLKKLLNEEF